MGSGMLRNKVYFHGLSTVLDFFFYFFFSRAGLCPAMGMMSKKIFLQCNMQSFYSSHSIATYFRWKYLPSLAMLFVNIDLVAFVFGETVSELPIIKKHLFLSRTSELVLYRAPPEDSSSSSQDVLPSFSAL